MPSVRGDQLDAHLSRQLGPLYVIHGDEPLLSLEAADAIRAAARKAGFTERSVLQVERNFKWGELGASGASMSLFGDKQLVELRVPTGKPGTEGAAALQAWCAKLSPEALLVVSVPRLAKKDQSSGWFTALSRAGVVVEVYSVDRDRLPEWLSSRLARQKQRADRETLQFLADSVEGNLLAAHQELQKLAMLLPQGVLDFDSVHAAVMNVARYDAGDLTEAVMSGDAARLARMLGGLRAEGEAPPRIVWIMAEDIRSLARVQEGLASGRPLNDVCRENRIWGDAKQRAIAGAAKRVTRPQLLEALSHAARIDRIAKGIGSGEPWSELLQLGLRFSS